MEKGDIQMTDFCSGCNEFLTDGQRIILAQNLKFFHFYCYKKKNCFFRFFNPIKSFFVWHQATTVEFNIPLKKSPEKAKKGNDDFAGGDINVEVHELPITLPDTKNKEEIEQYDKLFQKQDSLIDEENEEIKEKIEKSIDLDELSENLIQIMDEVGDMKDQIDVFSAEKEKDMETIKHLELLIVKYKKENMELRWHNNNLREQILL